MPGGRNAARPLDARPSGLSPRVSALASQPPLLSPCVRARGSSRSRADRWRASRPARRARTRRSRARRRSRRSAARRARSARPAGSTTPRRLSSTMMWKISRTISGASPSDGSSSISSFGFAISARPTASICRSPPDSVPASCARALPQAREQRVDLVHRLAVVALARAVALEGAEQQVVLDRHLAEQFALLRHQRHAARDHRLDRRLRFDGAGESHHAARGAGRRQRAHDRGEQRRLAGAVGTDDGDDLADADVEVGVRQRLDLAVRDGQVADFEDAVGTHRIHAASFSSMPPR